MGNEDTSGGCENCGPKVYVSHEENKLLVEIDDVEALACAINRVITDEKLRTHIINNGLKAYQQSFTKDVFKSNILDLYNAVI